MGTVTPDMFFPSTACMVQNKLGAKGAWGFDLSAACSAFIYSLQVGAQFIASGAHKRVLVIGAGCHVVDHRLHRPCHLRDFRRRCGGGDSGACGRRLGRHDRLHPRSRRFRRTVSLHARRRQPASDVSKDTIEKKMHYVHQDGQQVFKFAVRKQTELCLKLLERNGLKGSDIDAFIPHQANLRIINATAERLGLRPESVIVNIDRFGNTTAGTIPLAMNTAIEEGKLKKGSLVMLASVGAGFTIGATLMRWAF